VAFAAKADEYFATCENKPTLAGLCLFMGFSDKQSFSNYETYGHEFSLTVKKANKDLVNISNILDTDFTYRVNAMVKKEVTRNDCNDFFNFLYQYV
ncbi:MAG: hypothetical protein EBX21_05185, partial [Proteobacteria bacterium]|nr:hypothetical protein [Pseudomonadota bacterium]